MQEIYLNPPNLDRQSISIQSETQWHQSSTHSHADAVYLMIRTLVLFFFLHCLLPQVWHSRSLNYVWTASNILYHQAHTTCFIFLGTDAQSNSQSNYDDLLKMSPNTLLVGLKLVSAVRISALYCMWITLTTLSHPEEGLISDSWKQVKSEEANGQDAAVKALICLGKATVSGKSWTQWGLPLTLAAAK